MKQTILHAALVDHRVEARFTSRAGGATNWPHLVDGLGECVSAVSVLMGKRCELPGAGRSAGRGGAIKMPLSVYVAARVVWEADPETAKALADGSLEIRDDEAVTPLAIALARAQHANLIAAARALAEDDEGEETDLAAEVGTPS